VKAKPIKVQFYTFQSEIITRNYIPETGYKKPSSDSFCGLTPDYDLRVLFEHVFLLICPSENCKSAPKHSNVQFAKLYENSYSVILFPPNCKIKTYCQEHRLTLTGK